MSYNNYSNDSDSNKNRDTDDSGNQKQKISKTLKTLQFSNPGAKFSFQAAQGKRKIKSRNQFDSQFNRPIYDEKGTILDTNQDICDCLRPDCPGCHYQCKQCRSSKCGNKCRCNRDWYYEKIEIEGISKTLEMNIN